MIPYLQQDWLRAIVLFFVVLFVVIFVIQLFKDDRK